METGNIRNFCIIAHIDHGKSTLSDRFLEYTSTVEKRKMKDQLLDTMDLERERGITIKLTPVRMDYELAGLNYILNLIDTPGHVDFNYEVSRSLAAVEGAVLLVDASQGVQAQTLGNLYLALEQNLAIIPVINKIDLPNAQVDRVREEIVSLLGCKPEEILLVSGKTGQGVSDLLRVIVERIPPPRVADASLRALIFDSKYDDYRGVVADVRVMSGEIRVGDKIRFMAARTTGEVTEVGYFKPQMVRAEKLVPGEIGYVVTGLKDVRVCRVGDTITHPTTAESVTSLPGYAEAKPMVFAGIFPKEGSEFTKLREAVEKLRLNDAALFFEPEQSSALGFGLRCGFLGLLHLEIIKERLRREFGFELVVTTPSVAYRVTEHRSAPRIIKSAPELPDPTKLEKVEEPWVRADIVSPASCIGNIMPLLQEKRGIYQTTDYLASANAQGEGRVILRYEMPLAAVLTDFYDKLKSASSGYASLSYEFLEYRAADVVRLDILVAEEPVEALATLVIRDEAYYVGRKIVETLKENIPKHMFEVKIQAAIGGKIVAAERVPAMRKDVLAKMSGGDVTRKMKLLQKQKKGKKAMMAKGSVDIPTDAYLAVLKR
ncbi:MAG: translation elongation factor 4 [Patescibacteria group bacterium]